MKTYRDHAKFQINWDILIFCQSFGNLYIGKTDTSTFFFKSTINTEIVAIFLSIQK